MDKPARSDHSAAMTAIRGALEGERRGFKHAATQADDARKSYLKWEREAKVHERNVEALEASLKALVDFHTPKAE